MSRAPTATRSVMPLGRELQGSADLTLASKRTETILPVGCTERVDRVGAQRRAAEAGHLAEQAVERHAGKAEPEHRRGQQRGERGGAAVLLRQRRSLRRHLGDGDEVEQDHERAEHQRHHQRAAALARADLVLAGGRGSCQQPAGRRPARRTARTDRGSRKRTAASRASFRPARWRGWPAPGRASSDEEQAQRRGGDAVDRAGQAEPPGRDRGRRHRQRVEEDLPAGRPSRPRPPAASARRRRRNRSARTARAPRNAAASTGR